VNRTIVLDSSVGYTDVQRYDSIHANGLFVHVGGLVEVIVKKNPGVR